MWFVLWLFLPLALLADDSYTPPDYLADFSGAPSGIVDGCVNVVTGRFSLFSQDLVVVAPEPIVISRSFLNERNYKFKRTNLNGGWRFNHDGFFRLLKPRNLDSVYSDLFEYEYHEWTGPYGEELLFKNKENHTNVSIVLHELYRCGITNCGKGEISGATNVKNNTVHLRDWKTYLFTGEGSELHFVESLRHRRTHLLSSRKNLNRSFFRYNYGDKDELLAIRARSEDKELAHVYFEKSKKELVLKTSDNQKVHYFFNHKHHLKKVLCPNAPPTSYIYEGNKLRIVKQPHERRQAIFYYEKGDNEFMGYNVEIDKYESFQKDRVRYLYAPVGHNKDLIRTYAFYYHILNKDILGNILQGATSVFDAQNNHTYFIHDDHYRLIEIRKFHGSSTSIYSRDQSFWDDEGKISLRMFGSEHNVALAKSFEYDSFGNVIQEKLYGNLTGKAETPLTFHAFNQLESVETRREYTQDGWNLLLAESGYRKTFIYSYHGGTNLVSHKYTVSESKIIVRQFFEYDKDGMLIQEITDDGNQLSKDDYSGVTERKIRYFHPRQEAPYGIYDSIEEKALDLSSGQEVLIKAVHYKYNLQGKVLKEEHYDSQNNLAFSLQKKYDRKGHIILESDAIGQLYRNKYDDNGNLIFQQGPSFESHQEFTYDFANRLIKEDLYQIDKVLTRRFRYDTLSHLVKETNWQGHPTRYSYDSFGRITKIESPQGILYKEYDILGNVQNEKDPNGNTTKYFNTVYGKPYRIEYPDGTRELFEYSLDGILQKKTSRNGTITLYTTDYEGRITKEETFFEGELLSTISSTYSAFHLLSETNAAGIVTTYTYNCLGQCFAKAEHERLVTFVYDSLGRCLKTNTYINQNEYVSQETTYDLLNRVLEEKALDIYGNVVSKIAYAYANGQRTHVIKEGIQEIIYNGIGLPIKTIDPEGNQPLTFYHENYCNENGQNVLAIETIDPKGYSTWFIHNTSGKIANIQKKNAYGHEIYQEAYLYDSNGNLVSTTYPQNYQVRRVYDSMNRLAALHEGDKHTYCAYDAEGRLLVQTKPDGVSLFFTYDFLGRLKEQKSSDQTIHYTYQYDADSNPILVYDHISQTSTKRTYDTHHSILEEILDNGKTLRYTFDRQGKITQIILPDDSKICYAYKGLQLETVQRVKDNKSYTYTYSYDLYQNVVSLKGAIEINYTRDNKGRIRSIQAPHFTELIQIYDATGNLLASNQNNEQQFFSYDDLNQLTVENNHTYSYDSLYNRTTKDQDPYTYNPMNQLLQVGSTQFSYDKNGNRLSTNDTRYEYDALNRLVAVIKNDQKWVYHYDSFNRRTRKITPTREENYLYQGENEIGCEGELRILGVGLGAEIGAAVAIELNNDIYFPIHDHRGNVSFLLTLTQELWESYKYTVFGEENSDSQNKWRYASKRKDEETGFFNFGRRYYDPLYGRWLTPDPAGFTAGPNLYAYAKNNPLTFLDMYGLLPEGSKWGSWISEKADRFCETIKSGIEKTWNSLKDGASRFFDRAVEGVNTVGRIIRDSADALIPTVLGKDILRFAGHVLAGESITSYVPSCRERHSTVINVDYHSYFPNHLLALGNGMKTSFEEQKARIIDRQNKLGALIKGFYIASHNLMDDILNCFLETFGVKTNAVKEMIKFIREELSKVDFFHFELFSRAALTFNVACRSLTPEERARIEVIALGPGTIIKPQGLMGVRNFISKGDLVTLIGSPVEYLKAAIFGSDYVQFLESSSPFPLDHRYDSPTYANAREEAYYNFTKTGSFIR